MKRYASVLGAMLLVLSSAAPAAEEPVYTASATELKAEPARGAETLDTLAQKTALMQLARKGAWVQVRHGDQTGWVRLLVVRPGTPGTQRRGDSGLLKLFNIARSGSSGAVATTGVRGLDKEQIRTAAPNAAELAKLDAYVASESDARRFASDKPPLQVTSVPYLGADGAAQTEQGP